MDHDFTKVDRATLKYINVLLGEIDKFKQLLTTEVDEEKKRSAFQHLMTLTLGSCDGWNQLAAASSETKMSFSTLKRYVLHISAPHSIAFPVVAGQIREMLLERYDEVEKVVKADELAEVESRAKTNAVWQELVDRVLHNEPNTGQLNTQATYHGQQQVDGGYDSSLQVHFSYPCRGVYDFSDHFPHVCSVCDEQGKNPSHSRVFLNGEDGSLLLPHIIYSQADVLQMINDLENFDGLYFAEDETPEEWLAELREFVKTDPFFKTLPKGDINTSKPVDLNKEKLMWLFL